jgi:hypothetical protein
MVWALLLAVVFLYIKLLSSDPALLKRVVQRS